MSQRLIEIDDGIIRPEFFNKIENSFKRVLFVAKEPNKNNHPDKSGSFIQEWGYGNPKYTFAHRVAELAYGILYDFQSYDSISGINNFNKRLDTLKRIAFINVKKTGGYSTSSKSVILSEIIKNKRIILDQILKINPTHIIFGLSSKELIESLIGSNLLLPTGAGCNYAIWNEIKVLDFYHPSARVGNAALYALLKVNFDILKWNSITN